MKENNEKLKETLHARMRLFAVPSGTQLNDSRERVRQRLLLQDGKPRDHTLTDMVRTKHRETMRHWSLLAAAVLCLGVVSFTVIYDRMAFARVESEQGSLFLPTKPGPQVLGRGDSIRQGQPIRSGDKGGVLALQDGSRVEMRAESELLLERANDGVRIQLSNGSVIVSAAKQRHGHLYVQTKDVTVSVVGTVFLVNAEEEGSQVAVIDGEVRVQHGASEERLRHGEQVSTSPLLEPHRVQEEISWSRRAEEHLAMLQQSTNALMPNKAGTVTGVVTTTSGKPASGIRVTAIRAEVSDASLRAMVSLAETDKTGRYRLENIPAGNYYIAAGRVDLATFYPGTLDITKGTSVSISSAGTVSDINFIVQDTSTAFPTGGWAISNGSTSTSFAWTPNVSWGTRTQRSAQTPGPVFDVSVWIDPALWRLLGLSDDQKKKIVSITEQYRQTPAPSTVDALVSADILQILTEVQRAQLRTEWPGAADATSQKPQVTESPEAEAPRRQWPRR